MTYFASLGGDIDEGRQNDTTLFTQSGDSCAPANDFTANYSPKVQDQVNRILAASKLPLIRNDGIWDVNAAGALAQVYPGSKVTGAPCFNLNGRVVRIYQGIQTVANAVQGVLGVPGHSSVEFAAQAPLPLTPVVPDVASYANNFPSTVVTPISNTAPSSSPVVVTIPGGAAPAAVPLVTTAAPAKGINLLVIGGLALAAFFFLRKTTP